MGKVMVVIVALIILAVPFILVYQLTKADINISDFTFPINDEDPFENKCFLGQSECFYTHGLGILTGGDVEFREDDTYWWILGEDVWCIKSEMSFVEPVTNPNVQITQGDQIDCNDTAMFDKSDWDLRIGISIPDEEGNLIPFLSSISFPEGSIQTYTFTLKGT